MLDDIRSAFVPGPSQGAYDKVVRDSLGNLVRGLTILYAVLALLAIPAAFSANILLLVTRVMVVLVLLAILLFLRRRQLRPDRTHSVLAMISGVILIDLMVRLFHLGGFQQSISFVWLLIGLGAVYLSWRWFVGATAVTVVGCFLAAWLSPTFTEWVQLGISIVTGVAIAGIIQYVRLDTYERVESIRRQLETSKDVSRQIGSILEPGILLNQAVDLVTTEFGYDYVGIFLLERDGVRVEAYAETGSNRHGLVTESGRIDPDSPMGFAVEQRQPIRTGGFLQSNPRHKEWLHADMQAGVSLPLIVGQRVLGVLDLQSVRSTAFNNDDVSAMQSLADQMAIILRNAMLYEREETRSRLSETLFQISLALLGTLDRNEILDLILENLDFIVPYDRASLLLRDGDELRIVAARGFPTDTDAQEIRVPLRGENDVFVQIYETGQPLLVSDVANHSSWKQIARLPVASSFLGVPLLEAQEVIGMMSLVRERGDPYEEDDINPATSFAGQAVVALENARLYDEIANVNTQLEYEVEQRTRAMMQLAKLDQAKSDFINVASHELRTPLTTIKGYGQMLLHDSTIAESEYHHQMVEGIYQGAVRLHEIINSMINVAKIDNRTLELHPQELSVFHVIDQICTDVTPSIAERNLHLDYISTRDLPAIEADIDGLKQVFSHLIINAIKYTPDGGTIAVTGRSLTAKEAALPSDQPGVEVVVSDTGVGIAPEVQDLIFTKFYQTGEIALHSSGRTKFKGGGPGLGLAIVQGIIQAHNGRVWVDSRGHDEQNLPGSNFHVVLPIQPNGKESTED